MKTSNFFFILALISLIGVGLYYSNVVAHEKTHQTIYRYYGVNSSIMVMNPIKAFTSGVAGRTIADNDSNCNETCYMLHSQNEIVGYNVDSIVYSIWFLMVIILAVKYFGDKE